MLAQSLDDLKLLAFLGHFPFQQQHLQRLALLQVRRSRVRSEDKEIAVFLLYSLYALVEVIQILKSIEEEADAERRVYAGIFASSKGFAEIAVFILGDVFVGTLDVVWIEIDVLIFFHADEVQCFLWLSANEASEPPPCHHLVEDRQILGLRMIEPQPHQNNHSDLPFSCLAFCADYLTLSVFLQAFALSFHCEYLDKLVEEETGVVENYRLEVLQSLVFGLVHEA